MSDICSPGEQGGVNCETKGFSNIYLRRATLWANSSRGLVTS